MLYINSINPHSTLDKIADYERISETEKMYFDNLDEARKMRNNILTILKILSYGFIIVISLIGITNIFNAVSASIILKKREFASLLSYGMTNKQFKKMNLLEGIFISSRALLIGLPIGILFSIIINIIIRRNLELQYSFPLGAVVICIILAFALALSISSYQLSKIKAENIIENIRLENI